MRKKEASNDECRFVAHSTVQFVSYFFVIELQPPYPTTTDSHPHPHVHLHLRGGIVIIIIIVPPSFAILLCYCPS